MADKRMFSKSILFSDAFLDLPSKARDLYFFLSMSADDDGFVGGPKSVVRMLGASVSDLESLKPWIYLFPSGVALIKHWKVNNLLRMDRYKPTIYKEEKSKVFLNEDGVYELQEGVQPAEVIAEPKPVKKKFIPPTVDEVRAYCDERSNGIDPEAFVAFYSSKGWKVGSDTMRDWKSAVITWEKRRNTSSQPQKSSLDILGAIKL